MGTLNAGRALAQAGPLPSRVRARGGVRAVAQRGAAARARAFGADTSGALVLPLPAGSFRVSSPFGNRVAPAGEYKGQVHGHNGIDLAAPEGTPVYAAADGTVTEVWTAGVGRGSTNGNAVQLTHNQADVRATAYLHLSRVLVKRGQVLRAGQTLGLVGHTGQATGPHLHWIVYGPGGATNPQPYLSSARAAGAALPALMDRAAQAGAVSWTLVIALAGFTAVVGAVGLVARRRRARARAALAAPGLALVPNSARRRWRHP